MHPPTSIKIPLIVFLLAKSLFLILKCFRSKSPSGSFCGLDLFINLDRINPSESFKPATFVVVDTNENALAELTRDLRSTKGMYVPEDYVPYPMDFASPVFEKMFRKRGGFDIVGNFSAHKHVRSEKDIY